jgi:hypothetical protein
MAFMHAATGRADWSQVMAFARFLVAFQWAVAEAALAGSASAGGQAFPDRPIRQVGADHTPGGHEAGAGKRSPPLPVGSKEAREVPLVQHLLTNW